MILKRKFYTAEECRPHPEWLTQTREKNNTKEQVFFLLATPNTVKVGFVNTLRGFKERV